MDSRNGTNLTAYTERATIGPSVTVKGEISGEEDILIEGTVEGSVNLQKNSVTVAETGRVKANIYGVVIHVYGEVSGDLTGGDKIVIHKSGKVIGNIVAPTISLEEGGQVKGMMETGGGSRAGSGLRPTIAVDNSSGYRDSGAVAARSLNRGAAVAASDSQNS